jgi:protein-tyrosine phosphatase
MHQVFWIETGLPGRLATMPRPLVEDIPSLCEQEIDTVVSLLGPDEQEELGLECEGEECERCSIEFLLHPIIDRGLPSDSKEFARLADEVLERLREGKSVAVHCRMGIGRASLLAASVLVRSGVHPREAWSRIQSARGCPVPDTEAQRVWVERFASASSQE